MWDIYTRNVKGVFWGGFLDIDRWKHFTIIAALVHIVTLPLTVTFLAGIKTLFDFFTRKELPEDKINALNGKITALDSESIKPLISDMLQYTPKSTSSQMLLKNLQNVPNEASSVLEQAKKDKIRALQLNQLTTDLVPDPTKTYLEAAITGTKLDDKHQAQLDEYLKLNEAETQKQGLAKQKAQIGAYLNADENAGKYMQHVIHNHFFLKVIAEQPVIEPKDKPIQALP